jgi:uncharacterized RDD family membrane protein YckC
MPHGTDDSEAAPERAVPRAPHAPADPPAPTPAGALRRGLATVVDMVVFLLLTAFLVLPLVRSVDWLAATADVDAFSTAIMDHDRLDHAAGTLGLWMGLWWAYFAVGWGILGATPGKWVVGVRIIDLCRRCPIGVSRASLRLVAYCISSLTLGCGHAVMLVRRDRRALHDLLAGTQVVKAKTLGR